MRERAASSRICSCSSADSSAAAWLRWVRIWLASVRSRVLQRRQRRRLARDLGARGAGQSHHRGVLVGDPGHVAHLVEQVAESVGLEHDRHHVGLLALVAGHEVGRQRGRRQVQAVLEVDQAVARLQQRGLHGAQLGHAAVRAETGSRPGGPGPTAGRRWSTRSAWSRRRSARAAMPRLSVRPRSDPGGRRRSARSGGFRAGAAPTAMSPRRARAGRPQGFRLGRSAYG